MYLTGCSDEAGNSIDTQIRVTRELGWNSLELRMVEVDGYPAGNVHDIPEQAFEIVVQKLEEAGIQVGSIGSFIAHSSVSIEEPFEKTLVQVHRAIARMHRLNTKLIRIMSYGVRRPGTSSLMNFQEWYSGSPVLPDEQQMEEERFERLRKIVKFFLDAGITPMHQNCMNYGGLGYPYTLKLLDHVPDLKLNFDMATPVFADDHSRPKPYPKQSSWEFYSRVKHKIIRVRAKDAFWDLKNKKPVFTFPGEGQVQVKRILQDLIQNGYQGELAIEPHIDFEENLNDPSKSQQNYQNYIKFGKALSQLIEEIQTQPLKA